MYLYKHVIKPKFDSRKCGGPTYSIVFMPMTLPFLYRDLLDYKPAGSYEIRILRIRINRKQFYFWLETSKLREIVKNMRVYSKKNEEN